ncbi:clp1-like protein [Schizophyllum commune]
MLGHDRVPRNDEKVAMAAATKRTREGVQAGSNLGVLEEVIETTDQDITRREGGEETEGEASCPGPKFYDIPSRNIAAVAPDLAGVPIEYVHRGLYPRAREMIGGISTLNVPSTMHANHLPKHLNVGCRATPGVSYPTQPSSPSAPASPPTRTPSSSPPTRSSLPGTARTSSPSTPPRRSPAGASSPSESFAWPSPRPPRSPSCTRTCTTTAAVAQALFPALPARAARAFATHQGITAALGSGQAKHPLAAQLMQAKGGNLGRLTADAAHVKEAWQDMVSLGMYDAQLWVTIDLCWEVILVALNLAAAQQ